MPTRRITQSSCTQTSSSGEPTTSSESSSGNSSANTTRRVCKRPCDQLPPVPTLSDTHILTKDDIPSIVAAVIKVLEPLAPSESSSSTSVMAAQGSAQTMATPRGTSAVPSNPEANGPPTGGAPPQLPPGQFL